MRIALSGLGVAMIVLGVVELAAGHARGAILIVAALGWGIYWGTRYGRVPDSAERSQVNTEAAKTSAIGRWRKSA
jgi:hypothetical protein